MSSSSQIKNALVEARAGLDALLGNETTLHAIELASQLMCETIRSKGRIFSCGNGGSMCDAMHFAEELTGRYRKDRPAYPAIAISDPSHLACVGNDYGYEFVFSRYIEAHGRQGDVLLAISTSGTSKNVMKAAESAKKIGMTVVALTGKQACALGDLATVHIATPAGSYADRVQELHIKVIHILIELIERSLAPQNYN
jgi:D-sedoheptulose 7-phosphate isomerase